MGTDIHINIEAKDPIDKWHCVWSSDLLYSSWFVETYSSKPNPEKTLYNFNEIELRTYSTFGALSNVRWQNYLDIFEIGTQKGILHKDWPSNINSCAKDTYQVGNLHSYGWFTLQDCISLREKIEKLDTTEEKEKVQEQAQYLLKWCHDVERVCNENLFGTTSLIQKVIGRLPTTEEYLYSPNYPLHETSSAHQSLKNLSRKTWDDISHSKPENIRILIAYDD
jgi:hypothetical protein